MMEAGKLYNILNSDFIREGIKDVDWALWMPDLTEYLTIDFKQNGGMGLMADFAFEITKVYTTVFLSPRVINKVLAKGVSNALLFSHHPTGWDLKGHNGNYAVEKKHLEQLKEKNIAIYVLHHPLDNYGEYATCRNLADQLGIRIEKPALLYYGAWCGVIGYTSFSTVQQLSDYFSKTVGHQTSLYQYGKHEIEKQKVMIAPGGGNAQFVVEEMLENCINTLITGVTIVNEYSQAVHEYEGLEGINILGGTHYSTEKYATMKMVDYFLKLGIAAEFIDDIPDLYDL